MEKIYSFKKFTRSYKSYLVMAFLALSSIVHAQQTYTFTNAGMTGSVGPSQLQVNTAYTLTSLQGSVTVTGGIQSFTIPQSGNYRIEAWGAAGGTHSFSPGYAGGLGAYIKGDFNFTAGTVLNILVGQRGSDTHSASTTVNNDWDNAAAGGGGGSFVFYSASNTLPLMAAGGGGGGGRTAGSPGGSTLTSGYSALTPGGVGGTAGNGGGVNTGGSSYWAGGGAGWLTDGSGGGQGTAYNYLGLVATAGGANGGRAPINGGAGGKRFLDTNDEGGDGGFGGGGGGGSDNMGTGGGGGFSGGGGGMGGSNNNTGGGGGSYNSGTSQVNTPSVNAGHGKVIITELCSITLIATGTNSNGAICSGNSVTLTTNAISNYSWSTGATTSSIIVSPTSTTLYALTATSPLNCTTSAAITVTVNQAVPSLTVVNTASASAGICPTKTVMLTASGATTYSWSPTITNGVSFAPAGTATYIVTGYNACGTSTAATSVSIHPLPNITPVASSASICSGSTVMLTGVASGPGTPTAYVWSGGAGGITNGVAFSPALTATYTVIGTSALSCTAAATIPITVVATPSIAPTAQPILICIGKSSTLTATGATGYTWTSATSSGNSSTFVATPTSSGISTYTIVRANGICTTTQQISVVTNSLPGIFAFVQPTLVCALNPASISIGGGQTYTWTSPGNPPASPSFTFSGSNPVVYPPVPTTYSVAASDGTCINVTTVSVAVNPNPTITTSASTPSICNGQSVTISATGGINYTWTATSSATTTVAQSFADYPVLPTSYNVIGDNSFGCTSSAGQIVLVFQNPTLTANPSKNLVCSGGPSTITASGADTYVWTHNSAPTKTTIVNPINTITGPVVYTVIGTYSATGCNSSKTVAVSVFVPTITVTGNTNTCFGGLVNLTAQAGPGTSGSYKWYTTVGGPSYNFATLSTSVTAPTVFTVTAMTTSLIVNCPSSQTVDIGIYFNPTITAVAQRTTICVKEAVVLTATGGVTYVWSNNSQQTQTISVTPNSNATYTVTGTDANGCVNKGTVAVKVSGCVGINELNAANSGLIIYPNPNNGAFTIQSGSDAKLTLINELGQVVRTFVLSGSNNYSVSVSDVAKGVYFITGQKDGVQINQKVVVTK